MDYLFGLEREPKRAAVSIVTPHLDSRLLSRGMYGASAFLFLRTAHHFMQNLHDL